MTTAGQIDLGGIDLTPPKPEDPVEHDITPKEERQLHDLSPRHRDILFYALPLLKRFKVRSSPAADQLRKFLEVILDTSDFTYSLTDEDIIGTVREINELKEFTEDFLSMAEFRRTHLNRHNNRKDAKT